MKYLDIWYPHLQIDFQLVCLHFLTEYILDLLTLVANVLARSALPFFVVWRPHCAADTLSNRQQGFLCYQAIKAELYIWGYDHSG